MFDSTINLSALYSEWTLIVFTVLAQLAAGTALFASLATFYKEDCLAKKLWIAIFAFMSIAGIVSLLHLQNPFNALYTITQVGHSWLSREIITVGLFTGLVFLQIIKSNNALAYLTSLVGLGLVFVISQVYASVEAMPFWANSSTIIAFYGTAFLLGGAFALFMGKNIEKECYRKLAIASIVFGLVLSLASKLGWISVFMQGQALEIPEFFTASLYNLALQALFVLLGLLVILPKKLSHSSAMLSLGFFCLLLAELSSRSIFFIAQLKIGV